MDNFLSLCKTTRVKVVEISVFSVCALHPVPSSPGSLSHLGTLPGSDLVGLAACVCADGSGSACVGPLVSAFGSGGGGSSSEPVELGGVTEAWSMQLRWGKKTKRTPTNMPW